MQIYDLTDKILLHLGLSDLKNANLVSKSWNASVSEAYKTIVKTGSPAEDVSLRKVNGWVNCIMELISFYEG